MTYETTSHHPFLAFPPKKNGTPHRFPTPRGFTVALGPGTAATKAAEGAAEEVPEAGQDGWDSTNQKWGKTMFWLVKSMYVCMYVCIYIYTWGYKYIINQSIDVSIFMYL